jgi:RNA polymerase sigma factor (sigma-70 family)
VPKKIQLTRSQWARYAARIRWKTKREKLLLDAAPTVKRIARTLQRRLTHVPLEDLEQSGFQGLLEADRTFQPSQGKTFAAYAFFRIRGAMIDAHKRRAYKDDTLSLVTIDESGPEYQGEGESLEAPDAGVIRAVYDPAPQPEQLAERRERAYLLAKAVSELQADEREVFLGVVAGISLADIAAQRDRSVAWARAKLADARAILGAKVCMWGIGLDKAA